MSKTSKTISKEALLDSITDAIYKLSANNCQLRNPGAPLGLGESVYDASMARKKAEEAKSIIHRYTTWWQANIDSSSHPSYHVMHLISSGSPVDMNLRTAAVNYFDTLGGAKEALESSGIDKCEFISIINGWPKL
jgi:hypothetical protein